MLSIVRLINIQSYKDITFNLSEEINVLEAPNETGKSIMFKVFRTMCDANWYGRGERKSLIRRGEEKGTALLIVPYSGGVFKIVFEIYKTYQLYHLFDGNEKLDSWKQDTIPEDIINVLGWYYDKDSKILLNLCDQELDMPFVNSNLKFNYEVMKFIIQSPELERARFNIGNWLYQMSNDISDLSMKCRTLSEVVSQQKYIDTQVISDSISTRERVLEKSTVLCDMLESLVNMGSLEKPHMKKIDEEKIDATVDSVERLRTLGLTLQDVLKLERPVISTVDEQDIQDRIHSCKILNSIGFSLRELDKKISNMRSTEMFLQNAREVLVEFEQTHEVCPLCGQSFNSHECCG